MSRPESWNSARTRSTPLRFVAINLRGLGQVMFLDSAASGALFLAAIAADAIATGRAALLAGCLIGLVTATLTAMWLRVDARSLDAGLYGYNAALLGVALPVFLVPSALLWGCIVLGAAVSVVCMRAVTRVLRTWGTPALTSPFVLITWLLLLASYALAGLEGAALPAAKLVVPNGLPASGPFGVADQVAAVLASVSQVFFLEGRTVTALLFIAGLAVASLRAAVCGVGGALLAVLGAQLLGAQGDLIRAGLMGFSAVLTATALGAIYQTASPRVYAYAALGTVFTLVVQAAMNVLLTPIGIPTLTAPFIVTTWLFLLARPERDAPGAS